MKFFFSLVFILLVFEGQAANQTISIDSGRLSGAILDDGVRVFKGIPYAAPPVGELRWRAPQHLKKWEGIRRATEFGSICPQPSGLAAMSGGLLPKTEEDCLFLNVWTPALSSDESLPVMVWIHGGGLFLGWSNQSGYDGQKIANRGVVLVSINYRLGPLGFLAHPALTKESGSSGNYGFMDQVAALEWVKRNIRSFGGNPNQVTIFGESAGGTSVMALLSSPSSKGLVDGAIAQSPWFTEKNVAELSGEASAETMGATWTEAIAPGKGLAALRAIPAKDLVGDGKIDLPMYVTAGGDFLPSSVESIFARGEQLDVPLIVGTNADEGTMFVAMEGYRTKADFEKGLKDLYGDAAAAMLKLYPVMQESEVRGTVNQWLTDSWFLRAARGFLESASNKTAPSYQYHFTRAIPGNTLGAHHGAELRYVFNTLGDQNTFGGETAAEDLALAESIIAYWTQFAKTGNPNLEGLEYWPEYGATRSYLKLGDSITSGRALGAQRLDQFEAIRRGTK